MEETIPPPEVCPDCGHCDLTDLNTVDDRYMEDIPPALRVVTHRKYRQAFCPHCQCVVHHPEALHGPPVQTGPRLAAHLTQLRVRLGVTHRKLAVYATEVLGIPLTPSGVLGILFPNLQRCWIHFARDIHEERLITPNDSFLETLHDKTQFIMDSAQALLTGSVPAAKTKKLQRSMHNTLDEMTELEPPKSRALTLVERLRKHRHSLLNFLNVPGAEFHNNRAERQLRPVVIFRKLSFGNRTAIGACRYARLATVIETARMQKHNIQNFLLRIRCAQPHDFVSRPPNLSPTPRKFRDAPGSLGPQILTR